MIEALPLDTAFVVASRVDQDGRPVCDLSRTGVGALEWKSVPIMVLGGGRRRFLLFGPEAATTGEQIEQGAEVVIGFFANRKPVVLGVLGHPGAGLSKTDEPETATNSDLAPKIDRNTGGFAWDGAMVATRGGHIALTPAAGKDASVQLNGGTMRVSQSGEADDWAVLARALVASIAPLYAKVNEQDAQIAELTTKLAEVCVKPAVAALPPLPYTASETAALETSDVGAKSLRVSSEIGG